MTGGEGQAAAHEGTQVLFQTFGLNVTSEVVTEWAILLVLVVVAAVLARRLRRVPGRAQAGLELVAAFLVDGVIAPAVGGAERARRFLPFLGSLFLFILVCNYSGLLPGAGHLPGFKAPTSSLSTTVALAIVAFVATQYLGFREKGLGYFGHFFKPYVFMFPLNILEEVIRPVSLSLRLFGNIYGEETVLAVILSMVPLIAPIPLMALDLLFGFLQAFIFTTLTAVYIGGAIGEAH
ncbi:MAG: F0F1 ATP synthase subunit A [Clostridia bacterium]|nr:F0F1 ATP synthase subunit A [Clostridia bacterium]